MAEVVRMPKLGLQMKSGLITEWYVKEGDAVKKGTPVFSIETDKLTSNVESTAEGIVLKIAAQAGEEVEVTGICCYVGQAGEAVEELEEAKTSGQDDRRTAAKENPGNENKAAVKEEPARGRIKITPAAKKIAEQYQIDYKQIKGSGPNGRIQKKDILAAYKIESEVMADSTAETPENIIVKKMSSMRKTIGRRLTESKQNIPHVYFQNEIDATDIMESRELFKEAAGRKNGNKLTVNDIVLKAVAQALSEFEEINAQTDGEEIRYYKNVHLGFAVSVPGGLIVPVIQNAGEKSIAQLSREAFQLAQKARSGRLMPEEFSGGTFTVSNLGGFGIDSFQAIINPPESGILAVGSIKTKPVVVDGQLAARPMMTLTGSFDHRLVDGALAAQFMARISELLEHAKELFF